MKAKLNKEFFDIIDTEQKAYWLGFQIIYIKIVPYIQIENI